MREQFEKLPEIAEKLTGRIWLFNEKLNQYLCDDLDVEDCLNLALYAYQEPQKRIDTVLKAIDWRIEDCAIGEETEYNKAWLEAVIFVKQELLR